MILRLNDTRMICKQGKTPNSKNNHRAWSVASWLAHAHPIPIFPFTCPRNLRPPNLQNEDYTTPESAKWGLCVPVTRPHKNWCHLVCRMRTLRLPNLRTEYDTQMIFKNERLCNHTPHSIPATLHEETAKGNCTMNIVNISLNHKTYDIDAQANDKPP